MLLLLITNLEWQCRQLQLQTLGLVYDPGLDNSRSTVEAVKALAQKEGLRIVESPAMGLNEVAGAGKQLTDASKYIDLSFYEKATKEMSR